MAISGNYRALVLRSGLIAAAWTLVGLLLATQAWVARVVRGEPIALLQSISVWLAWSYLWALLTPLALLIWQRLSSRRGSFAVTLLLHLLASVVMAILDLAVYAGLAPLVGALSVGADWWATFSKLFGTTLLLTIPVYWIIIGVAQGWQSVQANRERERRELQLRAELGEARLQALRAQLQPHFLFNAMNMIGVLMREDVGQAHQVLLQLSRLLRRVLDKAASPFVPLREEIAFLESYLAIEKIRFQDRLHYQLEIENDVQDLPVPALLLQPLVENAARHGLAERQSQGRILICAHSDGVNLHLSVSDNGKGMPGQPSEGIGLSNTRARLQLLYGDAAGFAIEAVPDGGTLVSICLPVSQVVRTS